nr:phage tail tape measure protein [uncultured Butyricicoccus sp.]
MAERKISTRFAVEGEDQYKKSIADINSRMKTLKSELALVRSEYAGQENSMAALEAQGKTLSAMYAAQQQKVETARAALQNAAAAQERYAAQTAEYRAKLEQAQQALAALGDGADESSEAQAQLTEQIALYQQELARAEQRQRAAEQGVQRWQQSVNYAQRDLNQLGTELHENETALERAEQATQSAGEAVDELADSAEEAADAAQDMGDEGAGAVDTMAQALTGAGVVAALDQIKETLLTCAEASSELSQAQSVLTNTTNLSGRELEQYQVLLRQLYGENYGESLDDVAQTLATVRQQLDAEWSTDALKTVTQDAITLRDTFGYEVQDSIRAASALIQNFGIDGDEAFRLIAEGNRNGLDYSGELLDTISEYSVQFAKLGLSANDMFKRLEAGAKNGAWNLDKVGDAFKEFSIRVVDGSDTTQAGFEALGMNADYMAQQFAAGGEAARDALQQTMQALADMDDPVQQNLAGVNLLGTMWEDLGATAVVQMANIAEGTYGAADAMQTLRESRLDDLTAASEHLDRNLNLLAATAGDAVVPALANVKNAGADAMAVATEWLAQNPQVVQAVTALISGFALLVSGVTAYTAAVAAANVATKALDAMMKNNPYVLVATVVLSLVGAIGTYVVMASSASDKTRELNKNLEEIKSTHEQNVGTINATAEAAQGYIDKLEALESQTNLTDVEQLDYKQTVEELNALIPDLNAQISEETGLLIGGTEALRANTEAWQANAVAQEMQERYQEVLDGQAEATVNLTEKKLALRDAEAEMNSIYAEMQEVSQQMQQAESDNSLTLEQKTTTIAFLQNRMVELSDAYTRASEEADRQREAVDEAQGVLDGYAEEVEHVRDVQEELAESNNNAAVSAVDIENALANVQLKYEEAKKSALESINTQIGKWDEMDNKTHASLDTLKANLDSQVAYLQDYNANLEALSNRSIEGVDLLVQALSDGSAESAAILRSLADANDDEIEAIVASMGKVEEGKKIFSDTVAQFAPEVKSAMDAAVAEADRYDEMYPNGQNSMQGAIDGAESKRKEVWNKFYEMGVLSDTAYKAGLDEHSPSKKTFQAGVWAMQGAILGVQSMRNPVFGAFMGLGLYAANKFAEKCKIELDPEQAAEQAEAQMQAYVDEIEQQTDHAKEVMEQAGEDIQKSLVERGYSEDMAKEFVSRYGEMCQQAVEEVQDAKDEMQEQLDGLQKQWEQAVQEKDEYEKKLADFGELYTKEKEENKDSYKYKLADIEKQTEQMRHYYEVLGQLQQRLPQQLFSEILGMGLEDAAGYGEKLLALSEQEFDDYIAAWEEKQRLAGKISLEFMGEQIRQCQAEYEAKMQESMEQLKKMSFDGGAEMVRKLTQGMQSEYSELIAESKKMHELIFSTLSGERGFRVSAADVDGSHAGGLPYVPYDGYIAELHKGERVLTKEEASAYINRCMATSLDISEPVIDSAQVASMVGSALSTILLGVNPGGSGDLHLTLSVDGTEFARGILPYFRAAADQSPEIKSDISIR